MRWSLNNSSLQISLQYLIPQNCSSWTGPTARTPIALFSIPKVSPDVSIDVQDGGPDINIGCSWHKWELAPQLRRLTLTSWPTLLQCGKRPHSGMLQDLCQPTPPYANTRALEQRPAQTLLLLSATSFFSTEVSLMSSKVPLLYRPSQIWECTDGPWEWPLGMAPPVVHIWECGKPLGK